MRSTSSSAPRPNSRTRVSAVVLVRRPFSARIDGNAGGQRGREEFLRIDLIRQFDPEKNAAFRVLEFGRGAELLVERIHQRFELGAQRPGQYWHMGVEMPRAELAKHHLLQRA